MELISVKSGNREVIRIFEKGYNYSLGYYSENCWVDDDRLVLSRGRKLPEDKFYGGSAVPGFCNSRSWRGFLHDVSLGESVARDRQIYNLQPPCLR